MSHYTLCCAVLGAATIASLGAPAVDAQPAYPSQPVKFVVPNPPGGLPDVIIRIAAEHLRERLGQPILIENRPGANAGVGAAAVANSRPDGYTFLVTDSSIITINPLLMSQLPYDPKELTPVSLLARAPIFLAANPKVPAGNLKDLISYVKSNPDKLNYGTIGVGSFHHLSMEAMKAELGLHLNHIPYKGSGDSVTALRGGHIDLVFASYAALSPAIQGQQAKLIATNGANRSALAPDVPSISDVIPGFDLAVMQGVYARTGTPPEFLKRVATDIAEVLKRPEVVQKFSVAGIEPGGDGPDEMARALKREGERVGKLVKAADLKAN